MIEDPNFYESLKTQSYVNCNKIQEKEEGYKMVLIYVIKVILVRKDLNMGVGKIAAQVGHAGKMVILKL